MRILVVDDEQAVLDAYRHVLEKPVSQEGNEALLSLASALFEEGEFPVGDASASDAEITYASQGLDAVELVTQAVKAGKPYQVAFIDIRMPPGIDGKETAKRIRAIDPDVNLVIVSAYSDHSVTEITAVAGPADKIFYICKPFTADEVNQMAQALSKRWENDSRQIAMLCEKMAELAASEARAVHAANHDFLTGAPNRVAFHRELTARLNGGDRNFALAMVDLDRFKYVNDTFGHVAGDELLRSIYEKLRANAPKGSVIARLGGDEFGLIVDCAHHETVQAACDKVVAICSRSFSVFGNSVNVSASCGALLASDYPANDSADLMRYADIALFSAKRSGRQQVTIFDRQMDESLQFRRLIEAGLKQAITRNEFTLHYQPIVERDTLRFVGFEALLRWQSPEHGYVSPEVFIPIAEESSLIYDIGDWVVRQALLDCNQWPDQIVSINISPRQFKRQDFVDRLRAFADEAGVPVHRVQIEITETAIFENAERAAIMMAELQNMGFRIALDDFGTGYSNMFNVKNFALDCIKIDKSFIEGLGKERHSAAIINSITHLARALGLSVVAEGVETELQSQTLRVVGCSHMQGYYFGEPTELGEATRRFAAQAKAEPTETTADNQAIKGAA